MIGTRLTTVPSCLAEVCGLYIVLPVLRGLCCLRPFQLWIRPSSFIRPPDRNQEAYSAFQNTSLDRQLRDLAIRRLFVGGLATDYCVLNTVKDARKEGYDVCLLMDGIKAVNLVPDDGRRAEEEMISLGAMPVRVEMLEA